MKLTAKDFIAYAATRRKTLRIPEMDGEVTIREISSAEVSDLSQLEQKTQNQIAVGIRLVRFSLVGEDDRPMFATDEEVGKLPTSIMEQIAKAATEFNRLGDGQAEIEAQAGNSGTTPSV